MYALSCLGATEAHLCPSPKPLPHPETSILSKKASAPSVVAKTLGQLHIQNMRADQNMRAN